MTPPPGATMRDWLQLHHIGRDQMRILLHRAGSSGLAKTPDPPLDDAAHWPDVLRDLGHSLPQARDVLARIAQEVRIDLAPDLNRFPRAFTLHDDGCGLPLISCPLKGRRSDLLRLAHELGHACQILASANIALPPIHRETAAYLAERLVILGRAPLAPELALGLEGLYQRQMARVLAVEGPRLDRALDDPDSPYHYGWNYPIARLLAGQAALLPQAQQWHLFTGSLTLTDLLQMA